MEEKRQFVVLRKDVLHPDSYRPTESESYHLKVLDEMDDLIYQTSIASERSTVCESDMRGMGDLMGSLHEYEVLSLRDIAESLVGRIPDRVSYDPKKDSVFSCSDYAERCQDYGSRFRYHATSQRLVDSIERELKNRPIRKQIKDLEERLL